MDFFKKYKNEVDASLREFFKKLPKENKIEKTLLEGMKHGVMLGGKRIRVILGLLAYETSKNFSTKVSRKQTLHNLLSLEFIHAFSLIHDDLPSLDNDALRRGFPTVWKRFGEANAILIGDMLLNLAFFHLAKNSPPKLLPKLVVNLTKGCGGMLNGQIRDLDSTKASTLPKLLQTHSQKTGELISSSVRMGGILANANSNKMKLLESYAKKLGLAFQIKDDLLDALGDSKVVGKRVGKDAKKKGFVKVLGIQKSQTKLEKLIHESIQISRKLKSKKLEKLSEFVWKREK